jgi:sugar/nucleoside kinase (ribokinase family)
MISRSDVESVEFVPGGSTSNTARAVAQLGVYNELLTLIGNDPHGDMLLNEYARLKVGTTHVTRTSSHKTALSTLPVYKDTGKRAIYFCGGTNNVMTIRDLALPSNEISKFAVFHYGYPHLSPMLQGSNLLELIQTVHSVMITSLDINGADSQQGVIEPVLPAIDFLHSNIEEALAFSGDLDHVLDRIQNKNMLIIEDQVTEDDVQKCAAKFFEMGATMVAITLGHRGCFVKITDNVDKVDRLNKLLCNRAQGLIPGASVRSHAYDLIRSSTTTITNTTGAGDSFVGGFLSCFATLASYDTTLSLSEMVKVAQMAAVYRLSGIDTPVTITSLL